MFKLPQFVLLICCILSLNSCKTEVEQENNNPSKIKQEIKNKEIENIEVLFNETVFSDDLSLKLLRELGKGICDAKEKDLENYINPSCSAKFFKLFDFKEKTSMNEAFILLIKSNVHNFPLRRIYIYQREKGKLVKVNSFVANLIGKRKSKTAYQDLVLRFVDKDQNHFNTVYSWINNHYEYKCVEQINDSNVKDEFKDSMNIEILKVIEDNGMTNI